MIDDLECPKEQTERWRPLSLNAGQKHCRILMLQGHSAILSNFIVKLPFVIKFVLSVFEWPLKTGFTVHSIRLL